jgi:7-cyano-7-deazaguanine synthase
MARKSASSQGTRPYLTRAIVLLSGGIDSATALYLTKQETTELCTLNFVYAQGSVREAEASRKLAVAAQVKKHLTVHLPFFKEIQSQYRPKMAEATSGYVPARNLVFYGIASAYAETLDADRIVFGSNADDTRVLPDTTPEFLQRMNELVRIGTKKGVAGNPTAIVNPLIKYGKMDVLKMALELRVPLELTWSCYEDVVVPCGMCRGCRTRLNAFEQLGIPDPWHGTTT